MAKDNTYVLGMFPYPSGEGLHVGHGRIFTAVDVMGRYMRMKHGEVLAPMGWDAFGLPAENAAIKNKVNPQDIVPKNYGNFKRQMKDLSFNFDWQHEFATTDPTYYGLTQWLFLELYKQGLVYREEVPINWCPKCKTGLANEEVMPDGTHERCGTVTGKKLLPQWVMKITAYADRLLSGLDEGLDWPRGILEMQRNWIGKKEGMRLFHKVEGMDIQMDAFSAYPIWCFADTFMVIAPEHPLVKQLVEGTEYEKNVTDFVEESAKITAEQRTEDKFEKKGVFTGRYTNDPFNPGKKLPVWVANFAMMGFGTGIIRCSAHDPRDYEFARKYNIPLKEVVERTVEDMPVNAHTNEGVLLDSGVFTGTKISSKAIEEVKDWIVEQKIGVRETSYHLRDWVFSRQRYWGEPIPLVYCSKCGDSNGVVPLVENDLPLELPYLKSYEPTDTGESPLSRVTDWVNTTCPKCGGPARRETDTMPNWAGSCWYFLAFPWWSDKTKTVLDGYKAKSENPYTDFWKEVAKPEIDKWCPVDWYLGGAEHAVLHLLYARFWVKVFKDRGLLDFSEPFLRLRSVGMVLAEDGKKMSKSLGNVVNPDDMVKQFGSDSVRLYEMFMGPWDQSIAWDTRSLVGQKRFVEKVLELVKNVSPKTSPKLLLALAKLSEKVEKGIVEQKFNTSIAAMMEFVNLWKSEGLEMSREDVNKFAQILSPFAPVAAGQIFENAETQKWPEFSETAEVSDVPVTIAVQVNGKLRSTIEMPGKLSKIEKEVVSLVMQDERVKKWITSEIKKTIFVPGKLVNLVV